MKKFLGIGIIAVVVIFMGACALHAPPVINKSPSRKIPEAYAVKPGDSIYNISWSVGLDFLDIAKWNNLKPPYAIKPGQVIRLRQQTVKTASSNSASNPASSQVKQLVVATILPAKQPTPTVTDTAVGDTSAAPAVAFSKAPGKWNWPAQGKLTGKYSPAKGSNGIQITGAAGSAIKATAAGDVVYVGEGLRGYGKLIIVKHSPRFLSAYAHNRDILVKEGQTIKSGQQIARMGNSGTQTTMLHFEIREDGKPVDPLKYLK